jgi:hypothetical protein
MASNYKFSIGQTVSYRPPHGIDAPGGLYLVMARKHNAEFKYEIRSSIEQQNRMARESELSVLEAEELLSPKLSDMAAKAKRS